MKFPSVLKSKYANWHTWRMKKRIDIRTAQKAVGELATGCAFTPAYAEIVEARKLLDQARQKLTVEEWGE